MVVTSNYNLIPYPTHHYPLQPFISENALICLDQGQDAIAQQSRFQRPHSNNTARAIYFNLPGSRYDISQCLQYSDTDQVGHLVDIYA